MTTDVTKTEDKAGAVQPVKPREIDWTAIEAKWQEQREGEAGGPLGLSAKYPFKRFQTLLPARCTGQ